MAWWRRDPSLWARVPVHRYAQRILQDHEAVLRNRCLSRRPSKTAQLQGHDSSSRSEGTTDQEWVQLQRYRRWRKILQEHPYKGLFGASEDMLRGKGLTDWEWVYKTFPKWMLQEMDPHESANQGLKTDHTGRKFGETSDARPQAVEQPSIECKPSFAQPAIRTTHYERDEFGIVSPSDLRRPMEASHVKVVGSVEKPELPEATETVKNKSNFPIADPKVKKPSVEQKAPVQAEPLIAPVRPESTATAAKEASRRESSFISAFFADEPSFHDIDPGNSTSWRQTALQRRATSNVVTSSKANPLPVTKKEGPNTAMTSTPSRETFVIPSAQALVDNYPYPKLTVAPNGTAAVDKSRLSNKEVRWSVPEPVKIVQEAGRGKEGPTSVHVTTTKLESLPKDDIDFLSAEEIRAAMGRKINIIRSTEDKTKERQEMERDYATAKPKALDEVVEGHVLNNHYVRRLQQEFERAQAAERILEAETNQSENALPKAHPDSVPIESSIDRMRRWIEEGGTSLAKHFWQDPIEAGSPTEADTQFAKQMAGLGKSRRAREHISDDLEVDLPMCKGLLERLKNDEIRVEHAVYLLRTPRQVSHGAEISKHLRSIRERRLRNTYKRTEKQFEAACQALRSLDVEVVQRATSTFKRRLGIASRVLHKNHTLTRMLTWSVQARLDEPDLERSKAELYSEILTRLATLRDTQLALARLMDLAIQKYGVSFKPVDEVLSSPMPKSDSEPAEAQVKTDAVSSDEAGAKFLAETAAAARLADEIESQKAAMKGLSDDGYAGAPKHTPRPSFEENNPLANSLFRPFNLQLEGLGRKSEGEEAEEKLKEAFRQKMGDKKLLQEVRNAYEDTYGPITIKHRQVPQIEESVDAEVKNPDAFELLKENPVNQTAEVVPEESDLVDTTASDTPPTAEGDIKSASSTPVIASQGAAVEPATPSCTVIEDSTTENTQSTPAFDEEITTTPHTATIPSTGSPLTISLPTHYTILVHDPQTDRLSITTSTSEPPRDTSPGIPIHQALSSLKAPAKFIPYISPGLEIVTVKRHMLVLRDAIGGASSTRGFETVNAQPAAETAAGSIDSEVNPIDGTTRLSPTGYSAVEPDREQIGRDFSAVEPDREQIGRDFEERRLAAVAAEAARSNKSRQRPRDENVSKKRRGGISGVIKTAIWASAVCYIFGVTAEVLR